MGPDLAWPQQAVTVALNLAVALLAGAAVGMAWLFAACSPWAVRTRAQLRGVARGALAAAFAASLGVLWLEAAAMAEVPLAGAAPAAWSVLTATHYGVAWMTGIGALGLACIFVAPRWHGAWERGATFAGLAAIGLFLYSRSMVSHAGAGGAISWAVTADWIHLVLASLWLGAVFVAALVVLRTGGASGADRGDCANYIAALSRAATLAVGGLLATGLFAAWRGVGSIDNLAGNPYGDTLLVKAGLVACAAMLGGANRWLVMPGLMAGLQGDGWGAPLRRFRTILQVEAVVLFAVLVLAALLSSTPPPGTH